MAGSCDGAGHKYGVESFGASVAMRPSSVLALSVAPVESPVVLPGEGTTGHEPCISTPNSGAAKTRNAPSTSCSVSCDAGGYGTEKRDGCKGFDQATAGRERVFPLAGIALTTANAPSERGPRCQIAGIPKPGHSWVISPLRLMVAVHTFPVIETTMRG